MADKQENTEFLLPVGRLIVGNLFVKDVYVDERGNEGTPSYKAEIALDPEWVKGEKDPDGNKTLEEACADQLEKVYGADAANDFLDGNVRSPLLDGNKLAARREAKGKEGDAYKDKIVIRAHTQFNKHGENAPGGIQVFDEDVDPIGPANQDAIYNGCMVQAAISISAYTNNDGDKTVAFYLNAVQKVGDGERLAAQQDRSVMFKKVGRDQGGSTDEGSSEGGSRRRRRAG